MSFESVDTPGSAAVVGAVARRRPTPAAPPAGGYGLPPNLVDLRGLRNARLAERLQKTGFTREAARVTFSEQTRHQLARELAALAMDVPSAYRHRLLCLLPAPGDPDLRTRGDERAFADARRAIDDACSRLSGLPPRCQARLLRELPVPRPVLVFSRS